jgi:hypothetical protein
MAGLRSSVHTNPAMSNRCANGLLPADRGACPNSERIPRLLVTLHAIATLAAAFALVFAPTAIPGPSESSSRRRPTCRVIYAAAELCIGVVSWGASYPTDPKAFQLVVISFIVFHG